MFGTSLRRLVRTRCCQYHSSAPTSHSSPTAPLYQQAAVVTLPSRPTHQRRYSSSDASVPPKGGPRNGTAGTGTSGRPRGRKPKVQAAVTNSFANLPSVPATHHLEPSFINLSSFFSLHRPISLTVPIPRPATDATFASIFEVQSSKRHNPADVMSTIASSVDAFEGNPQGEESLEESWSADSASSHVRANVPRDVSMDRLVQHLRPFNPPPVPQQPPKAKAKATRSGKTPRERQWTTTITLTEKTYASGHKTYSASGTPLERLPQHKSNMPVIVIKDPRVHVPYTQKRREWLLNVRDPKRGFSMWAISVKRQRKLKMKKKKYKKLMKRTRNLRRKLGRI